MSEADKMSHILDTKYKKANLSKIARETLHLNGIEKDKLKKLLQKYEELFDSTLGTWKMNRHHVELSEDTKPYHSRPY